MLKPDPLRSEGIDGEKGRQGVTRKVFGILFQIAAGFFLYLICVLAFAHTPEMRGGFKLAFIGGFSVPAVAAWLIGLAFVRFENWRKTTGVVLLSAAGFTVFLIFSFLCLWYSPGMEKFMQPGQLAFFSDYWTGCGTIAAMGAAGAWLLRSKGRAG